MDESLDLSDIIHADSRAYRATMRQAAGSISICWLLGSWLKWGRFLASTKVVRLNVES